MLFVVLFEELLVLFGVIGTAVHAVPFEVKFVGQVDTHVARYSRNGELHIRHWSPLLHYWQLLVEQAVQAPFTTTATEAGQLATQTS